MSSKREERTERTERKRGTKMGRKRKGELEEEMIMMMIFSSTLWLPFE